MSNIWTPVQAPNSREGVPLGRLTTALASLDVRLDANPVDVRRQVAEHGYTALARTCQQLGRPVPSRDVVTRAHRVLSLGMTSARMDATLAGRTTGSPWGDSPVYRIRGLDYAAFLDAIPVVTIAAGKTAYNHIEGDVSGAWKAFAPGQSNAVNPYKGSEAERETYPVITLYADLVEPDWAERLVQGETGIDHRPAELAALQMGAEDFQYTLLTTGVTGYIAHNLLTLPMARVVGADTWSTSMTDANIDSYLANVAKYIADRKIAAPLAFQPRRAYVASTLMALLNRSNFAGGGTTDAQALLRSKLAMQGITQVEAADWLNNIGGSGQHGIFIPMDQAPRRVGYTGRVVAMSPTMVDSFQHEGKLVQRWGMRLGGLVQPHFDGSLMILVPAS